MRNTFRGSMAAAAASPTPYAAISYDEYPRRPTSRQDIRKYTSRPNLRRGAPILPDNVNKGGALPHSWKFSMGDSSDDEIPVPPMKFSAEAKALLGDEASVMDSSSPSQKDHGQQPLGSLENGAQVRRRSPPYHHLNSSVRERTASPALSRSGSPRIVRLNASDGAPSLPRPRVITRDDASPLNARREIDLVTPAPRVRNHQTYTSRTRSGSLPSGELQESQIQGASSGASDAQPGQEHSSLHETAAQLEAMSITRTRGEETGLHTSQRQKRGLKVTGRFLSGPARRGIKRRQSDEDQSPIYEGAPLSGGAPDSASGSRKTVPQHSPANVQVDLADDSGVPPRPENQRSSHVRFQSQASIITGSPDQKDRAMPEGALISTIDSKPKHPILNGNQSSERRAQPVFKVPPLPPLPSRYDQENDPPPTFKRNKNGSLGISDRQDKLDIMSDDKMVVAATPVTVSPVRPALAARSQNTPHRPAPPPPKMTVLETATATAGAASTSQGRKKRNQYMSVNGKFFTRMDCIGRGGSSKVYRVMAENFKVFALKRVTLEDQDELAIRGYKGEIDLLRQLEKVDRVVRLFDFEINEEKHTLSVLMEMGESDLNRVLSARLNPEDARLDITFTRYFWKEMLECVQAVHAHEIVHSDLKPANFLLLQGRLKLIDFGISNAIADDTVNVHREQHIGTPNYMSPEALIDSNAAAGLPSSDGKMMKLGKPSDVWSLGCILYQMTYGKPPFAHIPNQMQRIMAIPNPRHAIAFPDLGVGDIPVPAGLIRTLRRCLNRDPSQRPTVDQLLAYGDAFLFPDLAIKDTVPVGQELIARLQHNIIKHVREKGLPSDAELATWPARFFASIKAAVEEGRA